MKNIPYLGNYHNLFRLILKQGIRMCYREDPSERDSRSDDVSGMHVLIRHSYQFIHKHCRHGKCYE